MTIEIEHKRVVFDDDIASWLKQYSDAQSRIKEWQEIADIARTLKVHWVMLKSECITAMKLCVGHSLNPSALM